MSHELTTRANGFVEMAYVGGVPWHGLGQELTTGADINLWRAQAGMNWQVKRSRVRYGEGDQQRIFDDQHVLFRSDTKDPLAVVGAKYKIVQPGEVLEFFRELVQGNGFELTTAGTMFGGRRFWALASIGEGACILGNDQVNGFLLLSSSCDGTLATTAKFTTVRVVCNNTLSMALRSKDRRDVAISHRTDFDHAAVKAQLGIVHGAFGEFVQASRELACKTLSSNEASCLTEKLLVESKTVTKSDIYKSAGYQTVMALFERGKGNHGESAWDWVNGVTEFVDHAQRAKSESHRLANSWYGKGNALKTQAFEMALAY